MKVEVADKSFRPITITLETKQDFDKLYAIIACVAAVHANYTPQVIDDAAKFLRELHIIEEEF